MIFAIVLILIPWFCITIFCFCVNMTTLGGIMLVSGILFIGFSFYQLSKKADKITEDKNNDDTRTQTDERDKDL